MRFVIPALLVLGVAVLTGCQSKPKLTGEMSMRPPNPIAVDGSGGDSKLPPLSANAGGSGSEAGKGLDGKGLDGKGLAPAGAKDWQSVNESLAPKKEDMADIIKDRHWEPVYFDYNQNFIRPTEEAKLAALVEYLGKNSTYSALIEGHCDSRGSEEYNRALGERRALAVKEYLSSHGVADGRLQTISYGEDRPASQGDTEEVRRLNRRAEFVIYVPKKP